MLKIKRKIQLIVIFLFIFQFSCMKNTLRSDQKDINNNRINQKTALVMPDNNEELSKKLNINESSNHEYSAVEDQNKLKETNDKMLDFAINYESTKTNKTDNISEENLISKNSDSTLQLSSIQSESVGFQEAIDSMQINSYADDQSAAENIKDANLEAQKEDKRKTSLVLVQEHYNKALALYDSGYYDEAKNELKTSLHMTADLDLDIETFFRFGDVYKEILDYNKSQEAALEQNNVVMDTTSANIIPEEKKIVEELGQNEVVYDFPVEFNQEVENFIKLYTSTCHEQMEKRLAISTRYINRMKEIFKNEGLPQDLAYLPMIESEFKIRAYSRAGAAGLWQFIRSTGKKYKLKINDTIDERYDPEAATLAATKYLSDLYKIFDSWLLAEAAYNAGEFRILRAMGSGVTRNFWVLAKKKILPAETRRYVADFMANLIIAKNPEKYGFTDIKYEPALEYDEVVIDKCYDLTICANAAECSLQELKALNPALLRSYTPIGYSKYILRVPKNKGEIFNSYLSEMKSLTISASANGGQHIVKSGETMSAIAWKYGIPLNSLAKVNKITKINNIKIGMRLTIPSDANPRPEKVDSTDTKNDPNYKKIFHVVQEGDTLWKICKRYNVSINKLVEWNENFRNRSQIYPGEKLCLWVRENL
ncbi:LysM peptidoglycan-binding domain-containing protein [Candidatus Poribacteria bacterium]|nr:LysM peptidoglycan-binding domain-containing protein [Candidatus Poribacteria bacterium]